MPTSKLSFKSCFIFILLTWGCQRNTKEELPSFESTPRSFPVNNLIKEASGLADSKINLGYLWVLEDSGTPPQLFLIKNDGILLKSIYVKGATNLDWEDMGLAKGPNPALDYLYIADIGDNQLSRTECIIYRFPEPLQGTDTIQTFESIRFQYANGAHDAEAILVDNSTKDIYIITKSDNPSQVYKISYPQSVNSINQATLSGQLSFGGVTGAAISADGTEIIIKTYPAISFFERGNQKIEESLKKTPVNLTYQLEPQGEAVAFAVDKSGFYTISEKAFSSSVNLYFYKRK